MVGKDDWSNLKEVAMDALTPYAKAIVATIMALLLIIEVWTGWKSDFITEEGLVTTLAVLTPILVWLIPNRPATESATA